MEDIKWHNDAPNIKEKLKKIIDRMVAIDYRNRYQSAQDVLTDLNSLPEPGPNIAVIIGSVLIGITGIITGPPNNCTKFKDVSNVPGLNSVTYGGSTSFAELERVKLFPEIRKAHPDFKLVYDGAEKTGSNTGIKNLISNKLTIALSSRNLKENEHEQARKRNFTLIQNKVARDGIAIFIHKKNPVSSLTKAQIKGIFTGRILNWKEIDGQDMPIIPVSRNPNSGTFDFFQEDVMGNEGFAKKTKYVSDTTSALRQVIYSQNAIGYATASEVCYQLGIRTVEINKVSPCKKTSPGTVNIDDIINGEYPITRDLYVIIRDNNTIPDNQDYDHQAGKAFIDLLYTDEGGEFIEKAGLIPWKRGICKKKLNTLVIQQALYVR